MKKLLLNHMEAYQRLIGKTQLSESLIKIKLTYLRGKGLNGTRIGRNFYYTEESLEQFVEKEN